MTKVIVKRQSDELCHWKYIKREYDLSKGHYRYYYKDQDLPKNMSVGNKVKYKIQDSLGWDERKAYKTAKNTVNLHKDMANFYDTKAKEIAADKAGWRGNERNQKLMVKNAKDSAISERKDLAEAKKLCNKALKAYEKNTFI